MSEKNKSKKSVAAAPVVQKSAPQKGPTAPKQASDYKVPRGTARRERRKGLVQGWRNISGAKQMLPPKTAAIQVSAE